MKLLIAPLNWGLGHASRCLPLIVRHLRAGDDVVLAGDGCSLALLRKHFPGLSYRTLPSLSLQYSSGRSQVGAMAKAMPQLLVHAIRDHRALRNILRSEHFDLVISDNRFGFFSSRCRCIYITHQLHVFLPQWLSWAEPIAQRLHHRVIRHYAECWVPDLEEQKDRGSIVSLPWVGLSGELAHTEPLPENVKFIGPLSRFEYVQEVESRHYDVVAVLSGLEPQRTLLEQQLLREFADSSEQVLIVRGLITAPPTAIRKRNITLRPYMPDGELAFVLKHAKLIISRSGYSSLMDYYALGLLDKQQRGEVTLRLVATPGQPEQEYLANLHNQHLQASVL